MCSLGKGTMRHRVTMIGFVAGLALAPAAAGQVCGLGRFPTYEDLVVALENANLGLDTLSVAGNREFTVVLGANGDPRPLMIGAPTPAAIASATAACRLAGLWTSRSDSLAVNWLLAPQVVEVIPFDYAGRVLSLADRPRPSEYTGAANLGFPEVRRSFIAAARERAAGDIGRGSTMVLLLVDSSGRPTMT